MPPSVHPVDEVLPLPKLVALGLQHVLVMYANAVAAPLILGGALHLPKDQIALLINADLFACGIATIDRLWPHPDRVAEFLPDVPRRGQTDLRRRHHPDVDISRVAERVLQSHSREQAEVDAFLAAQAAEHV